MRPEEDVEYQLIEQDSYQMFKSMTLCDNLLNLFMLFMFVAISLFSVVVFIYAIFKDPWF